MVRLFALPVLILVAGCAAPMPSADLRAPAAGATGIDDAIQFRAEGGPTDVASGATDAALPLADAVRLALRHDPRVGAALARVRVAQADARQARLLPNPVLSVMVRFPEGGGDPMIEAGLMADLLSVLTLPRRTSAADHRLRAASAEALGAVLDVLAEAQQQYAAAQAADAKLRVVEDRRKSAADLAALARTLVETGRAAQAELLAAEAELDDMDAEQVMAESDRRQARLALARLVGQPSSPSAWELDPWRAPALAAPDERAWIDLALRRRPEVIAARWELAAAGDEAALAGAELFEGTDAGDSAEREEGNWLTGPAIKLPLPLFDWGGPRVDKAKAMRAEARHELTLARRQAVEDVRVALAELSSAAAAVEIVGGRLIPRQQQRRERAQAAFESGITGMTPVLQAEQAIQAARAKLVDLQQKASAAQYRLHRAAGGPGAAREVESGEKSAMPKSQ